MSDEIKELVGDLRYHVNNPSAWDTFDQGVSDMIEEAATALDRLSGRKFQAHKDAPDEVWLQIGYGDEGTHTWAPHEIAEDGIEEAGPYVRADRLSGRVTVNAIEAVIQEAVSMSADDVEKQYVERRLRAALAAEREFLAAKVAQLEGSAEGTLTVLEKWKARAERAEAEAEKLREALNIAVQRGCNYWPMIFAPPAPRLREAIMRNDQLLERALNILHNMALERKGWRGFLNRWVFHHEPLRNDAANLLREAGGYRMPMPINSDYVGAGDNADQQAG